MTTVSVTADGTPPRPSATPDPAPLKARAVRGAVVTVLGQGGAQGLRMVSNVVLSHLLSPEAFGIMALVRVLKTGLEMVSDVGIRAAVVRDPRGADPDFLNTAWSIQIVRGMLLTLLGAVAGYPMALVYREPSLQLIVPVATLSAFVAGLQSTKLLSANREMQLGRVVAVDLSAQMIALVTMVSIGWFWRSVWVLVIGLLVSEVARTMLSHVLLPGPRNRWCWDREIARHIVAFGKWILISTSLGYIGYNLDVILLGRFASLDTVGVYGVGVLVVSVPRILSSKLSGMVLYPVLAAANLRGPDDLKQNFQQARTVVLPGGLLVMLGAGLLSPPFFLLLYDARYHGAGLVAQLSVVALWLTFLHDTSTRVLLAAGDSKALAVANTIKLVATALGCTVGLLGFDLLGLLLGVIFGAATGQVAVSIFLRRLGIPIFLRDMTFTLAGLSVGGLAATLPHLTGDVLGAPLAARMVLTAAVVLVPYGLWVSGRLRRAVRGARST